MATIRKRGRAWQLNFVDGTGKRRQVSLGDISKPQATIILNRKKAELALGLATPRERVLDGAMLRAVADAYLAFLRQQKPASVATAEYLISAWFDPLFSIPRALTHTDIAALVGRMQEAGRKVASINRVLGILKAMLNRAVRTGELPALPFPIQMLPAIDSMPAPYYTERELAAIYEHAGELAWCWRLMANTGLRAQEALNLRWQDVDRDAGALYVVSRAGARTKSGRMRHIPLNETLIAILDARRVEQQGSKKDGQSPANALHTGQPAANAAGGNMNGDIKKATNDSADASNLARAVSANPSNQASNPANDKGSDDARPTPRHRANDDVDDDLFVLPRMRRDVLGRKFRRCCKRAGVTPCNIHTLRHTFCSHLVMAGIPLRTVQLLAGHAAITTTERYAHLADEHLARAMHGVRL